MTEREQVDETPKSGGRLTALRLRRAGGHTSAAKITTAERTSTALALRRQGCDYATIGAALDPPVSRQAAHKMVTTALRMVPAAVADEECALLAEQLRSLLSGLWPRAIEGDREAIIWVLRIFERQAKLFGLDRPARGGVTGRDGDVLELSAHIERVIVDPSLPGGARGGSLTDRAAAESRSIRGINLQPHTRTTASIVRRQEDDAGRLERGGDLLGGVRPATEIAVIRFQPLHGRFGDAGRRSEVGLRPAEQRPSGLDLTN